MAIQFLNAVDVTGEVQGTSLDINGNADISGTTVCNNTVTIVAGAPKLILKDNTDDDDHVIIFRNASDVDDYKIATQDFTSAATGDGLFIGSENADKVALVTNDTTALTLDTSQNATFAGDITCGDDLFMPSAGVINFNSGDMLITHSSNKLSISGGTTSINALELGQTDHVIEDGSNILDENDNTMMSFASGVANITGNAATSTKIASITNSNIVQLSTTTTQTGTKTFSGVIDITNTTDSSDATGDTGALRCEGGASIAKKLYAGSTITGSADVIAYSDQKLKENVKTLDGKKVLEMRGVSFDRVDTGKASSGVIAQEMEKVAPELVIDDGNYKGVAYGNIVGYLIEAIKDQQKQIDELKEMCRGCSK